MDKTELFAAISSAIVGLKSTWMVKMAAAFFVAAICNLHVQLLLAFAMLVIIDLITKWIVLSKQFLTDAGHTETNLWDCIKGMRGARRAGYIRSGEMKHRFAGKITVYLILTLGAAVADMAMKIMGKPEFLVVLVVGYLAVSEMLSVVENLQGAGVEEAAKLHDLINRKGNTKI